MKQSESKAKYDLEKAETGVLSVLSSFFFILLVNWQPSAEIYNSKMTIIWHFEKGGFMKNHSN